MSSTHTIVDSPVGPITLINLDGVLTGLYMDKQRHGPRPDSFGDRVENGFDAAREQLDAYFAGTLTDFDLPLNMRGTPFQQRVWAMLREIPYGETTSYGELAAELGNPKASRAVGYANGHNPVSIIVPCHRVVGSTGDLTGYGGGIERKRFLLDFERKHSGAMLAFD
ncbi:methylated-DNA--[protein]-cysteine S-methyltransferase [Kibdelosporangium lantanae]|uniref:Methylated-DNA--protein-cysteine methyltransferase n=1 Tax=Kibdelosporangium lantanae TaxID=1497396 RepID=A0ABW3MEU4_9PSEU